MGAEGCESTPSQTPQMNNNPNPKMKNPTNTPPRYVVGDSRFQRYCKSNPRKMVKMWAEKELRNLARLHAAGVRAPQPLQLRMHVLAMQFLGSGGVAAPRLRDAGLPPARMRQAYGEMVLLIRTMYQKCRLVHADLSEYNVLVHQNELWIIDVSQSVEPDHPRAFDFLREGVGVLWACLGDGE